MKNHAINLAVTVAIGILFSFVAVYVVGFSAAIRVPSWSQAFAQTHRTTFFWIIEIVYVALPLTVLATASGALLGRAIRMRSLGLALLCAVPWLAQVAWSEIAVSDSHISSVALLALPDSFAVVAGFVVGMLVFGYRYS